MKCREKSVKIFLILTFLTLSFGSTAGSSTLECVHRQILKTSNFTITLGEEKYTVVEDLSPIKYSSFYEVLKVKKGGQFYKIKLAKKGSERELMGFFNYEFYALKYYQTTEIKNNIIKHTDASFDESGYVYQVSPYIDGPTGEDMDILVELFGADEALKKIAELDKLIVKFQSRHRSFVNWLETENFQPNIYINRGWLVTEGDFKRINFVYDVERKKWICIDP